MKLGFTGTRQGMTNQQKDTFYIFLNNIKDNIEEFHHGDCIGSDEEAHDLASNLGIPIYIHPPVENKYRAFCQNYRDIYDPKPYLERNKDIVKSVNLLIAAPKLDEEELRSGTWATVRHARKNPNITILILATNGFFYFKEIIDKYKI